MSWRVGPVLVLVLCAAPTIAHGHARTVTRTRVSIGAQDATITATFRRFDLTSLGEPPPWLTDPRGEPPRDFLEALTERYALHVDDARCERSGPVRVLASARESLRIEWRLACSGQPTAYEVSLLPIPGHIHVATLRVHDTELVQHVFTRTHERFVFAADDGGTHADGAFEYLKLGAMHVLSGWDHVAFVTLLMLLARRLGHAAMLVTGFTLGHSLTLVLATVGAIAADLGVAEVLIAYSVLIAATDGIRDLEPDGAKWVLAWVAALPLVLLALSPRLAFVGAAMFAASYFVLVERSEHPTRLRAGVAMAFGLMHGLGFATALDLSPENVLRPLLGFNVGVEVAQLLVVGAVWPLLAWARRRGHEAKLVTGLAPVVGAVAVYAIIVRASL